ncbi:MAG TPA: helix-turn-helix domain-containing protein [Dehalococcoidia bacterium]|jgi:excisionase family DNA binding protein
MTEQNDLMTVREVARACHRSEETVRRWIWSGKLRARKLGNQLFVARSDLEALSQPAVREAKSAYRAGQHEPRPTPFTPEEAEAWLARVNEVRERIVAEYGPTDVTELLREIRGEDE